MRCKSLLLIRRKKQKTGEGEELDAEKVEQDKIKWSPMTGKDVIDVDAAKVGPDGSLARLTKPVEGTGTAGALGGGEQQLLLTKAQEGQAPVPAPAPGPVPASGPQPVAAPQPAGAAPSVPPAPQPPGQ